MIRNYLLVALRLIRRTPGISAINIGGLAIAMAATLIIVQYVGYHLSFDNFHEDSENIYRLGSKFHWSDSNGDQHLELGHSWEKVGEEIARDFPEVLSAARFTQRVFLNGQWRANLDQLWISPSPQVDQNVLNVGSFASADPSFFDVFSFEMIEAQSDELLLAPDQAVLSSSLASEIFPDGAALGKTIYVNGEHAKVVVGIYQAPLNSSLRYDVLFSMPEASGELISYELPTYQLFFKIPPRANVEQLAAKLTARYPEYYSRVYQLLASLSVHIEPIIQPLHEVHFSRFDNQEKIRTVTYPKYVFYVVLVIGFAISGIAAANYFNLSAAQLIGRVREVGVRRVMGDSTGRIFWRYMIESIIIMVLSFFLALTVSQLASSYLGAIGLEYESFFVLSKWWFWLLIVTTMIGTSGLVAFFKHLMLRGVPLTAIFQGKLGGRKLDRTAAQNLLMGIQFICTTGLIIGIAAIYYQINYVLDQDLGFDSDQVLVLDAPQDAADIGRMDAFFERLRANPSISDVTASLRYPSKPDGQGMGLFYRPEKRTPYGLSGSGMVEANFTEFFGIELVAGRNLRENYPPDTAAILLSEHAMRRLEFEDPEDALNSIVYGHPDGVDTDTAKHIQFRVVGIFEDYQIHPLHTIQENRGLVLFLSRWKTEWPYGYYSVKLSGPDIQETIASVRSEFQESFPRTPFNYFLLDENIGSQYEQDKLLRQILMIFTVIAILLSCLGLFALSSILLIRKTKEIGIRKVLGASMTGIFRLFARSYIALILGAALVAIPLSWYLVSGWLDGYAVRVTLSWPLFVLPVVGLGALILGLLFVQVDRVSKANPCESLRYE